MLEGKTTDQADLDLTETSIERVHKVNSNQDYILPRSENISATNRVVATFMMSAKTLLVPPSLYYTS